MGGLGSDVAIETADVIIQTDQPSKIARAIKIGRSTRHIVWQNIGLAFGVKIMILILGAGGLGNNVGSCFCRCWCGFVGNFECCEIAEDEMELKQIVEKFDTNLNNR